ncbi:hypothetical protein GCM10010431_55960 [Streptomyces kunmingensis]
MPLLLAAIPVFVLRIVIVPVTGILIGGTLTATVLAGRRALDELHIRNGAFAAGLALGLLDRNARLEVVRPAASDALPPGYDQTRTVGLVILPGVFVGMLLGGASPVLAGAVPLFLRIALMAVSVALTVELAAQGRLHRAEPDRPQSASRFGSGRVPTAHERLAGEPARSLRRFALARRPERQHVVDQPHDLGRRIHRQGQQRTHIGRCQHQFEDVHPVSTLAPAASRAAWIC